MKLKEVMELGGRHLLGWLNPDRACSPRRAGVLRMCKNNKVLGDQPMTTINKRINVFTCLILMLVSGSATAQVPRPTAGKNLALGKACIFTPPPDYHQNKADHKPHELTDGLYVPGCAWAEQGTVGWGTGRRRLFMIDIDLGAAYPIGKITFNSVTGSAQVTFPAAVLVFVSTDGKQYDLLCDVLTESLPQNKPLTHRFIADNLRGWGRYVRLAILPGVFYSFSDEIEIMKGTHTRQQARYISEKPIPAEEVKNYAIELKGWVDQKNATLPLLREADDAVTARSKLLDNSSLIAAGRKQIDKERVRIGTERLVAEVDYSQGPPYRQWDRRAFQVVARLNSEIWRGQPVVIWQKNKWEWLRPLEAPAVRKTGAQVRVDMMNNEWATSGFIVTSASDEPVELTLTASDFGGPQTVSSDGIMRISHVVHAEARGYNYRDDPIVPLDGGVVMLQPGVSKRIWLTFKTRGMNLNPGPYTSTVNVSVNGKQVSSVPVELRIWPLRFPDEVSLYSVSWVAFSNRPSIVGHEDAAIQDLQDHYSYTALVMEHGYMPRPTVDAEGNFTKPLDFTKMDRILDMNPECRLWLLWTGFEFWGNEKMGTKEFGTPAWENSFTQYVTQIRDHLEKKGIGKKQFAWWWTDEPGAEEWEEVDFPASKLLKKIDPEMLVWADPSTPDDKQLRASLPYVDILCMSSIRDVLNETKLKSWHYVCASEKNAAPWYYRGMGWKAWKNGLGGIGMWVYADRNNGTFSDYVDGASYAMVYKGDKGPISSKRWEAWRQGIADYEYLRMLSDAVAAARKAGVKQEACNKAQVILTKGVDEILREQAGGANKGLADKYRVPILECLTALRLDALDDMSH